jgi:hypothetical protein
MSVIAGISMPAAQLQIPQPGRVASPDVGSSAVLSIVRCSQAAQRMPSSAPVDQTAWRVSGIGGFCFRRHVPSTSGMTVVCQAKNYAKLIEFATEKDIASDT